MAPSHVSSPRAAWTHLFARTLSATTTCVASNLVLGFLAGALSARAFPALVAAARRKWRHRRRAHRDGVSPGGGPGGLAALKQRCCAAISQQDKLTLKYFDIPALAEPIRVLLALGHFAWRDQRVAFDEWPALKARCKWGQVPVLVSDDSGAELTQCKAICRYLAKLVEIDGAALYPRDDAARAFAIDELIDTFEDVRSKIMPTMRIADQAEKERARQKLFADDGECTLLLRKIDDAFGPDGYAIGSTLTLADVWCYFFVNLLRCGFMEGIPADCMNRHAKLASVTRRVAELPEVKKHYQAEVARGNAFCAAFLDPPPVKRDMFLNDHNTANGATSGG